jgi:alpha-tubulin suppressor-like RCC1 family protein
MRARIFAALLALGCGGESTGPDDLAPVTTIRIEGVRDTILLGETRALRAIPRGPEGQILADRPIAWTSSDPSVVAVSHGGRMEALAGGTATITATSGTASAGVAIHARRLAFDRIFAGTEVSCGLEASGEAWCWGAVGTEGTGNGSIDRTRSDVPLRAASASRFTTLAIGSEFICGLRVSSDVVCWGGNEQGQLGDGSTAARAEPAAIAGLNGATAIVAGGKHACALVGLAAYCWGANESGQLGDGTRIRRPAPVPVMGLGPVTSLAAGYNHTCAAVEGRPFCWGNDNGGQLGHDTLYIRPTPMRGGVDPAHPLPYTTITASFDHTCGLITGGAAYCWGLQEYPNDFTQLNHTPVQFAPGHEFAALYNGWSIQCGRKADSSIWCWGLLLPPIRAPMTADIIDASVSSSTVCMLESVGAVHCWNPVYARSSAPAVLQNVPAFTSIAAGRGRMCGLSGGGELWCWDEWGSWEPDAVTAVAVAPGMNFTGIQDGVGGVCALTDGGDVWCMGDSALEQGPGGHAFVAVSAGSNHACGLTADGTAWCWGQNDAGQLGDGTTVERQVPVPVEGGIRFTGITAGESHTCGTTAGGDAFCWGSTALGQMGDGTGRDSPTPIPVDGNPSIVSISAGGGSSTCGRDAAGLAHCWPVSWQPVVRTVTAPAPFSRISVGSDFACGLDGAGAAYCWGRNVSGVFGNGQQGFEEQWTPQRVSGGITFATIAAGQSTVCGIATDGVAYCWGSNALGSVGAPSVGNAEGVGLPARLYGQ